MNSLVLDGNSIGNEGARFLTKQDWQNLTRLSVNSVGLTSKGAGELTKANWNNLEYLDLDSNNIGE